MSRIGVIGEGNDGSALARGLGRAGHDVRTVGEDPKRTGEMNLAVGSSTSGAEDLQTKLPGARVVKAFNTRRAHGLGPVG